VLYLDNYGGIFDCYSVKGLERHIIMAGVFTPDDIYNFTKIIKKDFVEQFIKNNHTNNRVSYYGARWL